MSDDEKIPVQSSWFIGRLFVASILFALSLLYFTGNLVPFSLSKAFELTALAAAFFFLVKKGLEGKKRG